MPRSNPEHSLEQGQRAAQGMDLFDVYVLRFEVNEERATRALMQVFGLSEAAARIFVHSVPRIGKRDVPTAMAERYVRALHAVGAVVECRRRGSAPFGENTQQRAGQMSLPAPSDGPYPGNQPPPTIMQDSMGIMAPLAYAPDMPQIPKAPRIPADLHHIRARKGPDSLAPNWRASDGGKAAAAALNSTSFKGMNSEASLWSDPLAVQMSSDPLTDLQAQRTAAQTPPAHVTTPERRARPLSSPAPSTFSSRPFSPSPFAASQPTADSEPAPWYATATNQLLLAAIVIAGMAIALSTGVFETDVNRTSRAFQQAGIDPGTYEPAERYLAHSANRFQPLSAEQLRVLIDRLAQAGAREVWVADIHHENGQRTAHTLLLDLPADANARRALFGELATVQRAGQFKTADVGQRFLRVDF